MLLKIILINIAVGVFSGYVCFGVGFKKGFLKSKEIDDQILTELIKERYSDENEDPN